MTSTATPFFGDKAIPFRIDDTDIRGQIACLGPLVDEVLTRHDYPPVVCHILGETLVLSALLGISLKFQGKLTLQIQGDGPIQLMVVDFQTTGALRGYAKVDEDALAQAMAEHDNGKKQTMPMEVLFGKGHLALTIDQGLEKETYQGIVELKGDTLSDCALVYFGQSEQILTAVKLAVAQHVGQDGQSRWRAGGIMAQSLPITEEGDYTVTEQSLDDWEHVAALLSTTQDDELTDPTLEPEQLLYRLFHENGVRVFDSKELKFQCTCSEEKIHTLLKGFTADERADMVEEGRISVHCEFCSHAYLFKPEHFK